MVRFGATAIVTLLVVACSGQTLEGDPFTRGVGGAAATGGGAAAGAGGATGGGMSGGAGGTTGGGMAGGTGGATGGTGGTPMTGGTGGMPGAGGTPMTGGSGGMPMMGGSGGASATGGVGGEAGAGICELPLVSGSCQALFYVYGFDASLGHCVLFPYGGCEGNENRFETLGACEDACGGSTEADCPDTMPGGLECEPIDHPCHYTVAGGCLCVPTSDPFGCDKVDPNCPQTLRECIGEDCVGRIIAATRNSCDCIVGAWSCFAQ